MTAIAAPVDLDAADYLSVAGEGGRRFIAETESAAAFRRHMARMKLIERRLDEAYAGCLLIKLLIEHPWLSACRVTVAATTEFDDQGGTFVCATARVGDLVMDHGLASRDEAVIDDSGTVCEDLAEDLLSQCLWDDEQALLDAVTWVSGRDGGSTEYAIWIDRDAVSEVLQDGVQISGARAYAAIRKYTESRLAQPQ